MNRLGLLNMTIGFIIVFIAAAAGAFIAWDLTEAYLVDSSILNEWQTALQRSAHGHSNLFGYLHILFGLTIVYSKLGRSWKLFQTIGLLAGSLAMGPGMLYRASLGPNPSTDLSGLLVGFGLSLALLAIASHAAGIAYKLSERGL